MKENCILLIGAKKLVEYKLLDKNNYQDYQKFVLPYERSFVLKCINENRCTVIGAVEGLEPAGLGVLTFNKSEAGSNAFIHTINVLPVYRNLGIGRGLLHRLIEIAQQEGFGQIAIGYVKQYDWAPYLERIILKQGFKETYQSNVFDIQVEKEHLDRLIAYMKSLLRGKRGDLPPEYRLIPYKDITPKMQKIIEEGRGIWIEERLDPFVHTKNINIEKSLFLLKDEVPVGWLIICNAGSNGVLYRNMLIKPGSRGTGLFLIMLLKGLEWLCESGKIKRALFNTDAINKNMLSTMPKVLEPCVYAIKTNVTMTKKLS